MKAGMDGSNSRTIVRGLSHPCGIAIDFSSSLLYWADFGSMSIKSSNLDGSNVVTVVQLSSKPYGIAVAPQRLYWGLLIDKKVQTSTMTGGDIRTIYTGNREVRRLTFTAPNMPTNRTNPCTSQSCTTGVCVLTPTLFRCLSWAGSTEIFPPRNPLPRIALGNFSLCSIFPRIIFPSEVNPSVVTMAIAAFIKNNEWA